MDYYAKPMRPVTLESLNYYSDLAFKNSDELTPEMIPELEKDPRYRPSLVHNRQYFEFITVEVMIDDYYSNPDHRPPPGVKSLGVKKDSREIEKIRDFRRVVKAFITFMNRNEEEAEALRMSAAEEARPKEYPRLLKGNPGRSTIKQHVLFTLKDANCTLSIQEMAKRTGIDGHYISVWLQNNWRSSPKIEKVERAHYRYCLEKKNFGDGPEIDESNLVAYLTS